MTASPSPSYRPRDMVHPLAAEKYTLVKMSSHIIETSDGEKMVALRTLPAGVEAAKLPLVLLVHGGPWARDRWGWNAQVCVCDKDACVMFVQRLANMRWCSQGLEPEIADYVCTSCVLVRLRSGLQAQWLSNRGYACLMVNFRWEISIA